MCVVQHLLTEPFFLKNTLQLFYQMSPKCWGILYSNTNYECSSGKEVSTIYNATVCPETKIA